MQCNINIDMTNEAFAPYPVTEFNIVLRRLGQTIANDGCRPGQVVNLYDSNGNRIGQAEFTR